MLILVCAIKYSQRDETRNILQIIPVAGTYPSHSIDAKTTLLTATSSDEVEGVRVELHGKTYQDQQQSAIIELSCDKNIDVQLHTALLGKFILTIDWRDKYSIV